MVKPIRHSHLFQNPETLQRICSDIILPNMIMRQSDEEIFEDDPMEYLRRHLEGSDSETRRRSSADLVRALLENFGPQVTEILSKFIGQHLQLYEANRVTNWRSKDTALYLITALSATAVTSKTGATKTNALINVGQIFEQNIVNDLIEPVNGSVNPIIKVDALKFLTVFRSHVLFFDAAFKDHHFSSATKSDSAFMG